MAGRSRRGPARVGDPAPIKVESEKRSPVGEAKAVPKGAHGGGAPQRTLSGSGVGRDCWRAGPIPREKAGRNAPGPRDLTPEDSMAIDALDLRHLDDAERAIHLVDTAVATEPLTTEGSEHGAHAAETLLDFGIAGTAP